MGDSCLNNPGMTLEEAPASLGRALGHNRIPLPPWLVPEATRIYLPARRDGRPACSPSGNASAGVPRCCRVYEDFWQDLNMQCSEDVLFDAARAAAATKGAAPPPLYAWRFDQVEGCPPAVSGWGGAGHGKLTNACFHTMDLAWMFGTVSAFWSWLVPPDGAPQWNCTWGVRERSFSDGVIRLWASLAASRGRGRGPAFQGGAWPAQASASGARINLKVGNAMVLRGFRRAQCSWWATAYARIRASQGYPG